MAILPEEPKVTIALEDLLPDSSGEIVLDGLLEGVKIETSSEVVPLGQVESHKTEGGVDVHGYHSYSVNEEVILYSPVELNDLIEPDDPII